MYHLKRKPRNNYILRHANEVRSGSSSMSAVTLMLSPLLLGLCSRQCAKAVQVRTWIYSLAECIFILERYFTSKSFTALREAFSKENPDKEVPITITLINTN
jgi:hypothetical protein